MGRRLYFDLETNGLKDTVSKIHLLLIRDLDSNEEWVFRDKRIKDELKGLMAYADCDLAPFVGWIEDGIKMLEEADLLVGHNIIDYDIPVLEKLCPNIKLTGRIRDTLILARLLFSDIKENDYPLFRKGVLPGKLLGSQGLKAWGYRLGEHKGEYDASAPDAWEIWTPEMETYGRQDTVTGKVLWEYLVRQIARKKYSQEAITLEHRFADLIAKIEDNGFPFKEAEAKVLYDKLDKQREKIKLELVAQFRPWYTAEKWEKDKVWKEAVVTVSGKTMNFKDPATPSRTKGAKFCAIKRIEFNPGSRDQISDRLQRLYGWIPKLFTKTGKPKVSEDVLKDLVGDDNEDDDIEETEDELYNKLVTSVPQAKNLADYFLKQKRCGQLFEGKNGWLKLVRGGKIHGSVNSLGAVTRRVTHAKPNMSQCPAVRSEHGVEMRSLFHVPKGWLQFGTDLSGIEIRCFADALAEFDGGAYADIVVNGDVHSVNQLAFGVPTRDLSKTTLYAVLYGAGEGKLGSIVGQGAEAGRKIKQGFIQKVPAYKKLGNRLNSLVDRQGWIPALDGGQLSVRSAHKALNTSLQSAGALVAKAWSCLIEDMLLDYGWKHGWDGDFVILGFFHDELQIAVRAPGVMPSSYINLTDYTDWTIESAGVEDAKELGKKIYADKAAHHQKWYYRQSREIRVIASVVKKAIKEVEKHFEFICPLDCEYKVGLNWADCH